MILPANIEQNSHVRIVSTARFVVDNQLLYGVELLKSWGLKVSVGKHLFKQENQFAGSEIDRIYDLQTAIDDVDVDVILLARGGYGTVKIIDHVNFESLLRNPKWIIGYSDVTVLHSHLHENYKLATLHASMPVNFEKNTKKSLESIKNSLWGAKNTIEFESNPKNKSGKAEGILVGGNLSILYSLLGSKSDVRTDGKVLFIEDLDEYLYHIDRMMVNMDRNGKLKNLAGLIVGGFSDMRDNEIPFGKSAHEIILDSVKDYDFPVIFDFPAGHIDDNRAIILGKNCSFSDTEGKTTFIQ